MTKQNAQFVLLAKSCETINANNVKPKNIRAQKATPVYSALGLSAEITVHATLAQQTQKLKKMDTAVIVFHSISKFGSQTYLKLKASTFKKP